MIEWTDGANQQWQKYCEQIRQHLAGTDADTNEVIEDLRRDVNNKLIEGGAKVITESDIVHIINKIGMPGIDLLCDTTGNRYCPAESDENKAPTPQSFKLSPLGTLNITMFGIILPIITLVVELTTRTCTDFFFDPIPTIWHVLLLMIVPVSTMFCLISIKKNATQRFKTLGVLNAVAIGIAGFYSLIFLPLLPISVLAIIAGGLGFCGLSPILSLFALLNARRRLKALSASTETIRVPGLFSGLALSMLMMTLAVLPSLATRIGIQMATSDSAQTQLNGIKFLRNFTDEDHLLEACYRRQGGMLDFLTIITTAGDAASPEQVRKVYYRVTGKAFNSVKPPSSISNGSQNRFDWSWDLDWDENQGESRIGKQLKGLAMQSSLMDASIDADAVLGYLEWTMVFENNHFSQREARAKIQLPSGAVVSRLTLWIDGQEREAAFASRSQTQQAYQSVVRRQRDPVLVTTDGPDRITMQCFPVPPNAGIMKIRIGMTVPLNLINSEKAVLRLPYFNSRNFDIPDKIKHSIWIESKQAINSETEYLKIENPKDKLYALRGELDDQLLATPHGSIEFSRNTDITKTWSKDPLDDSKCILQQISYQPTRCPEHVVLVIDASFAMKPVLKDISEAVKFIPPQTKVSLLIANDAVESISPAPTPMTAGFVNKMAATIRNLNAQGGMDNVPALKQAWDMAAKNENSIIVWVYAGQPYIVESPEVLLQHWKRRPDGPDLIQMQIAPGIDNISKAFDTLPQVTTLACTGKIVDDLKRLFRSWQEKQTLTIERDKLPQIADSNNTAQTSDHLSRLWAYDNIRNIIQIKDNDYETKALELAASYQLVTPVSGAVVLENQSQYDAAGLQPVAPASVPTIPEPEVWALMVVVFLVLVWAILKKRSLPIFS